MNYEEFKRFADIAIKAGIAKNRKVDDIVYSMHLAEKVKNGTPVAVNGRIVINENDAESFKSMLSVCICMTTIAKDNAHKFYNLMRSTRCQDTRDKYGLKECFCEEKNNIKMNERLNNLCKEYDKSLMNFANKANMDDILLMCDEIDKAEEMLKPIINAYNRLMMFKVTRKTLSTPLDPVLLRQMIITFVLISICKTLYGSFEYNFPSIKSAPVLGFLKMEEIFKHMNKMLLKLDYHDTKMEELKMNINSLVSTNEAQSIGDDIISLVLSLDFQRELLLVGNPDLKIEPMHHVSLMPSLDKITLTIDEYKEKYDKMFRYDKAV